MHSIEQLQEKLNAIFASLNILAEPRELYSPIDYTLSLGGKRIRPLLVLAGCDLFRGDLEKAINVAIGIELFHNFTLLHDDIMDQAPIRRGMDTVHKKWNANVAILSGDTMFALATEYISKTRQTDLPEVLQIFIATARQVCEGQQYDMNFESRTNVSIADYMEMIRLKTAVLIACSLKLGAVLAGAETKEKNRIWKFGESLGLAFQLQDDLLDIFGEGNKFGKEIGGDILAGKKTFLYIKALEVAGAKQKTELLHYFASRSLSPDEKIRKVKDLYRLLHVDEITRVEISSCFDNALQWLDQMNVEEKDKNVLREYSNHLLAREF
jgi:geranylgeranyl diphosphate synthase, type II